MELSGELEARVQRAYYIGGHMMYSDAATLRQMNEDIGGFIRTSS